MEPFQNHPNNTTTGIGGGGGGTAGEANWAAAANNLVRHHHHQQQQLQQDVPPVPPPVPPSKQQQQQQQTSSSSSLAGTAVVSVPSPPDDPSSNMITDVQSLSNGMLDLMSELQGTTEYQTAYSKLSLPDRFMMMKTIVFKICPRPIQHKSELPGSITTSANFFMSSLSRNKPALLHDLGILVGLRCSFCFQSPQYLNGATNFVALVDDEECINMLQLAIDGRKRHVQKCPFASNSIKECVQHSRTELEHESLKEFLKLWYTSVVPQHFDHATSTSTTTKSSSSLMKTTNTSTTSTTPSAPDPTTRRIMNNVANNKQQKQWRQQQQRQQQQRQQFVPPHDPPSVRQQQQQQQKQLFAPPQPRAPPSVRQQQQQQQQQQFAPPQPHAPPNHYYHQLQQQQQQQYLQIQRAIQMRQHYMQRYQVVPAAVPIVPTRGPFYSNYNSNHTNQNNNNHNNYDYETNEVLAELHHSFSKARTFVFYESKVVLHDLTILPSPPPAALTGDSSSSSSSMETPFIECLIQSLELAMKQRRRERQQQQQQQIRTNIVTTTTATVGDTTTTTTSSATKKKNHNDPTQDNVSMSPQQQQHQASQHDGIDSNVPTSNNNHATNTRKWDLFFQCRYCHGENKAKTFASLERGVLDASPLLHDNDDDDDVTTTTNRSGIEIVTCQLLEFGASHYRHCQSMPKDIRDLLANCKPIKQDQVQQVVQTRTKQGQKLHKIVKSSDYHCHKNSLKCLLTEWNTHLHHWYIPQSSPSLSLSSSSRCSTNINMNQRKKTKKTAFPPDVDLWSPVSDPEILQKWSSMLPWPNEQQVVNAAADTSATTTSTSPSTSPRGQQQRPLGEPVPDLSFVDTTKAIFVNDEFLQHLEGNIKFRQLISEHRSLYFNVDSPEQEHFIVETLVELIHKRGGSFYSLFLEPIAMHQLQQQAQQPPPRRLIPCRLTPEQCLFYVTKALNDGFSHLLRESPMTQSMRRKGGIGSMCTDIEKAPLVGRIHQGIRWNVENPTTITTTTTMAAEVENERSTITSQQIRQRNVLHSAKSKAGGKFQDVIVIDTVPIDGAAFSMRQGGLGKGGGAGDSEDSVISISSFHESAPEIVVEENDIMMTMNHDVINDTTAKAVAKPFEKLSLVGVGMGNHENKEPLVVEHRDNIAAKEATIVHKDQTAGEDVKNQVPSTAKDDGAQSQEIVESEKEGSLKVVVVEEDDDAEAAALDDGKDGVNHVDKDGDTPTTDLTTRQPTPSSPLTKSSTLNTPANPKRDTTLEPLTKKARISTTSSMEGQQEGQELSETAILAKRPVQTVDGGVDASSVTKRARTSAEEGKTTTGATVEQMEQDLKKKRDDPLPTMGGKGMDGIEKCKEYIAEDVTDPNQDLNSSVSSNKGENEDDEKADSKTRQGNENLIPKPISKVTTRAPSEVSGTVIPKMLPGEVSTSAPKRSDIDTVHLEEHTWATPSHYEIDEEVANLNCETQKSISTGSPKIIGSENKSPAVVVADDELEVANVINRTLLPGKMPPAEHEPSPLVKDNVDTQKTLSVTTAASNLVLEEGRHAAGNEGEGNEEASEATTVTETWNRTDKKGDGNDGDCPPLGEMNVDPGEKFSLEKHPQRADDTLREYGESSIDDALSPSGIGLANVTEKETKSSQILQESQDWEEDLMALDGSVEF